MFFQQNIAIPLYRDVLLKNIKFIYNRLFCCNNICYCVGMVSVTSASRYQSRSSMYIRGLIPRNSTELAEAVPIAWHCVIVAFTGRTHLLFAILAMTGPERKRFFVHVVRTRKYSIILMYQQLTK